jgi:hypothetical protein
MLSEETTERTPALWGILLRLPHGAIAFDRVRAATVAR